MTYGRFRIDIVQRRGGCSRGVLVCTAILCFLVMASLPVSGGNSAEKGNDPRAMKGFIRYLAGQGEYSLARRELYRLRALYPGVLTTGGFSLAEDHLLFGDGRFDEIISRATGPSLCSIYRFDSLFRLGRMDQAYAVAGSCLSPGQPVPREMMARRLFALDLLNGRYTNYPGDTGLEPDCIEKLVNLSRASREAMKNPWTGGSLALFPGAGYMYAGDTKTGIVALLVISVTTTLSVLAFETDNMAIGGIFGAVTVFFYGGNIIGGYRESLRTNRRIRDELAADLEKKLDFERDRDNLFRTGEIGE